MALLFVMGYNETLCQGVRKTREKMLRLECDFVTGKVLEISGNAREQP
jgi:hypothetical protein